MLRSLILAYVALVAALSLPARAWGEDWPQWRGRDDRNGTSSEIGLPDAFDEVAGKPEGTALNNVRWVARLGGNAFGSPVVAGGKVYTGGSMSYRSSGALWCFNESDGKLLWRMRSPFCKNLINTTWGTCSTPTVDGDRVYLLGHNGDVLCLDANGLAGRAPSPADLELIAADRRCPDRNQIAPDGRRILEVPPGTATAPEPTDAHIIWRFDLLREVNCWPYNAQSAGILVRGNRLYVATGSTLSEYGKDGSKYWVDRWKEKYGKTSYPSPSLIVLDKFTGKLLAVDKEGIFDQTFHGANSTPALGTVGGRELLFYGGGNGVCYAFDPEFTPGEGDQPGVLKRIWKFDCLAPSTYDPTYTGPRPKRAEILATPVLHNGRIYIGLGNDPRDSGKGAGPGRLVCIDASGSGDITATGKVWSLDTIKSSCSTVAIAGGLLYTADCSGTLFCLDAQTGKLCWDYQTGPIWSSPVVADGKVYVSMYYGLLVFAEGKVMKLLSSPKAHETENIASSPAIANGSIYIASDKLLYALKSGQSAKLDKTPASWTPLEADGIDRPEKPTPWWLRVLQIGAPVTVAVAATGFVIRRKKGQKTDKS